MRNWKISSLLVVSLTTGCASHQSATPPTPSPKISAIAAAEKSPAPELSIDRRAAVDVNFDLARTLYVNGHYLECLSRLEQVHNMVTAYKNSRQLESFCYQGMALNLIKEHLDSVTVSRMQKPRAPLKNSWKVKQLDLDTSPVPRCCDVNANVAEDTTVDHPLVNIKIPKGWTVIHGRYGTGPAAHEGFTITPNNSQDQPKLFLRVDRMYSYSPKKNFGNLVLDVVDKGHNKAEIINVNGTEWLRWPLTRQPASASYLSSIATVDHSGLWLISITTGGDASYDSQIEGIYRSIRLK